MTISEHREIHLQASIPASPPANRTAPKRLRTIILAFVNPVNGTDVVVTLGWHRNHLETEEAMLRLNRLTSEKNCEWAASFATTPVALSQAAGHYCYKH